MASSITRIPFLIQDENSHCKKANFDVKKTKSSKTTSKTTAKKGGQGLGSRRALGDITNKPSTVNGASAKKNNVPKEEFNIAEERFLHDHSKCIKEEQALLSKFHLDLVLPPRHGFASASKQSLTKEAKADLDIPSSYPEPEELLMSEFDDWLGSSTRWKSPPRSPIDSPEPFSVAWEFGEVEFSLKFKD